MAMVSNWAYNYAFVDLNNDGLDDFYCIGASGEASVSINLGSNSPTWDGLHEIIDTQQTSSDASYSHKNVHIAEYVFGHFFKPNPVPQRRIEGLMDLK